jgi:class 3 adenylate cyclase/pimeloyl-ACP methyl ester carboxylesterase
VPSGQTRYAKAGGVHVAYQAFGEGTVDLVVLPDGFMTIDAIAELPAYARFRDRLASFSRTILFDRRGLGLSDPVSAGTSPTLEDWAEDLNAVADAASANSLALVGIAEGAFSAVFHAASYPASVSHLVLVNATPGYMSSPFCDWGEVSRFSPEFRDSIETDWGTDFFTAAAQVFAPSAAGDPSFREWLGRATRRAASPATATAFFDVLMWSDIRHVLPVVQVPTLVIHRSGNRWMTPAHGRYLAENIANARYIEVEGSDHLPCFGDSDAIIAEIEEFLTGARSQPASERVLATILFTDIVSSTARASELGDRRWRELLDRHDEAVRRHLAHFRGREVNTTGDGFVATFDGPARAVECARVIRDSARQLDLEVRAGVHTGEVELRGDDIGGIAVHIAARVASLAEPACVWVSRTVTDLVAGSGLRFSDRGDHELKGAPGTWRLYAVQD